MTNWAGMHYIILAGGCISLSFIQAREIDGSEYWQGWIMPFISGLPFFKNELIVSEILVHP
jgi:hypothetical protein